ncbi:MAG: methyltransferase domain-containing protein [Thermoplasmata archaeon]|nr:MAG: methyltransferase domain-containing protein [Thermoplasmata archaeon]
MDYTKIARYYDNVRITSPDYLRFWSSRIMQYGSITERSKVLDIGCGTGRFTLMLAKISSAEVYAIDPSDEMLSEAKKKDKKKMVVWRRGGAEKLPFPDEHFDCVYMTFVFHHVKNGRKAISEMRRVLKSKGKCVILTISHGHIRSSPLYLFPGARKIDLARFPTLPELKNMLRRGGFSDVHYHMDRMKSRKMMPINQYLGLVKRKHVSTLTFFDDEEFKRRYRIFKRRLRERYGDCVKLRQGLLLVSGCK